MDPQKESGLGRLLKGEREKKGFSLDQLSRITRLRRHFIEALEDENWDRLPSPVYVKGFIRSYAQGLGFDGKEAISLYERIAPVEEEIPKPLTVLKEPKRRSAYFIIPFFAVLALGVYLWADNKVLFLQKEETEPAQERGFSLVNHREINSPEGIVESESSQANKYIQNSSIEELGLEHIIESVDSVAEHPTEPVDSVFEYSTESVAPVVGELVLTGIVNMRTYIKIYVDNNLPKEYIFPPGKRPQWVAREGFDILVGNAGGIEFDFNGIRRKDLGDPGEVIRIRFPEDFESKFYGN